MKLIKFTYVDDEGTAEGFRLLENEDFEEFAEGLKTLKDDVEYTTPYGTFVLSKYRKCLSFHEITDFDAQVIERHFTSEYGSFLDLEDLVPKLDNSL